MKPKKRTASQFDAEWGVPFEDAQAKDYFALREFWINSKPIGGTDV